MKRVRATSTSIRLVPALAAVAWLAAASAVGQAPAGGSWPQWGGPRRNFMSDSTGLASSWPSSGPRRLWSRTLGEGHSSIAVADGRLYTMYRPVGLLSMLRRSQEEVVAAIDAATGKTVWEHRYPSDTGDLDLGFGAGPHSTPLVSGDLVFATGSRMEVMALDRATGAPRWSHDLRKEFGGRQPDRGYSTSPLAWKDTVIVTGGGRGQAVIAFRQRDGAVAWKSQDLEWAPASPVVIPVDGQAQLVVLGAKEVMGLDPDTGARLWSHPHATQYGLNISTPVWGPDSVLFLSSAYDNGSRALELHQKDGRTTVTELWETRRLRVHFTSVLRVGDHFYGSSGDFGPGFLVAVEARTGRVAWQDRAFARANLLYADGKAIVLDEDGNLGLVTLSPQGLTVLARAEVLASRAWTVPALAGTTLFVRDRKTIAALELGR